MDVITTLQKAREIITPEDKWCVGLRWRARADGGYAHCALGAIEAVTGLGRKNQAGACEPEVVALAAAIPAAEKQLNCGLRGRQLGNDAHVATYNNRSDHKTVLEWFDRAIELQRQYPMERA